MAAAACLYWAEPRRGGRGEVEGGIRELELELEFGLEASELL